jgi:excisionase family DNA binding protein
MQVLTTFNQTEFQTLIADSVKNALQNEIAKTGILSSNSQKQFLSRQETADLLSISLVTLDNYVKAGYINAFRLGFKVRFKYLDVLQALTKINMGE